MFVKAIQEIINKYPKYVDVDSLTINNDKESEEQGKEKDLKSFISELAYLQVLVIQ